MTMNPSPEQISEQEFKIIGIEIAEAMAREYAGQSASNGSHIAVRDLNCTQGSGQFLHQAFREPIVSDIVVHRSSLEPVFAGPMKNIILSVTAKGARKAVKFTDLV